MIRELYGPLPEPAQPPPVDVPGLVNARRRQAEGALRLLEHLGPARPRLAVRLAVRTLRRNLL